MCVCSSKQAIYVLFYPVSSTHPNHVILSPSSVQSLYVVDSRSLAGDGEQEGVSARVPLPPPLMSSTTGTGEREGDGSVDGDGRLVLQLMVDKDGKIIVNENRCLCGGGSSMLD